MSNKDNASTFAKGLAVLDCFADGSTDLTMAEIARRTGYDRATARRLCLTLESCGYVSKRDKFLRLTPKVVAVAGGYLTSHNIGRNVQPVLNQFAEELAGEIALAVREGTQAVYVARSTVTPSRPSLGFTVGSTLPLLPTAVGRMLLATCPIDLRDQIIDACPLDKFTEATDLDPDSIRAKVRLSADRGYAYSVGEFETGASGVAVPVSSMSGAQAVLSTTASINRLAREGELDRVLDLLRRAAMSLRS